MNLQEAISVLTVYQEWRMGAAEIFMLEPKQISEAIRIILDDHLHRQLETKPGFVERREEQAWDIIEGMVVDYVEEKIEFDLNGQLLCSPYDMIKYLKTICHPPTLKQ